MSAPPQYGKPLKHRLLRQGGWTLLAYGMTQATRLLSSLIMTRLLIPEVFGVMAIALVIHTALALFSDIGLFQSVVRSTRGDERQFLDTLWVVQILRGFALWATALALALGLAAMQAAGWMTGNSVYAHPALPHAIAAVGFTAVLAGFESTKVAVARRTLTLGRVSQLEIAGNLVAVATTIAWAFIHPSIWALLGGWIAGAAFRTILTHTFLPGPRNRFQWDRAAFREIVHFGKWVAVSSAFTFLAASGDRLILSSLLSSQQLGVYSIAVLILGAIQQGLSRLASHVFFPLLSQVVRDKPDEVRAFHYKARLPIDLSSLGFAGFLLAAGELVVGILYDGRYASAGHMLSVLALTLIGSRYEVAEQVFLALGKSRLLAIINAVRVATLFAAVPLGYLWAGLEGALWGIVGASLLPTLVTVLFCRRNAILDFRHELARLYALPAGFIVGTGAKSLWHAMHLG